MSLTSIKCTSACIYTRNVYCSHQISWWYSSAYEMTFKLPTDRGCMADEGIYKMKAPCICTLTLLVKSKQFFLFRWALFTDSSTFIKQKQVGFRLNTICFFIESFTVSCNENKIFAKTCKDLQVTGLWHIVTQIQWWRSRRKRGDFKSRASWILEPLDRALNGEHQGGY